MKWGRLEIVRGTIYLAFVLSMVSNYFLIVENYNLKLAIRSFGFGFEELMWGTKIKGRPLLEVVDPDRAGVFKFGDDYIGCAVLHTHWDVKKGAWVR